MKKLILLLMAFAALANGAVWGQITDYYAEEYTEHSGKLLAKEWVSGTNIRSESIKNGEPSILILRGDSMKAWNLNPVKKTYIALDLDAFLKENPVNRLLGEKVTQHTKSESEYLRTDEAEGKMCKVYRMRYIETMPDGSTNVADWEEWIYEPWGIWIKKTNDVRSLLEAVVLRNVKPGPQPAHLFEVPKDYKGISVPLGGLLEMLGGEKSGSGSKEKKKDSKPSDKKSDMEQMMDAFKKLQNK